MTRQAFFAGLAAAAAVLAFPAGAQEGATDHASVGPARAANNMIHAAALNPEDQALADRIADALSRDRAIHNAPVTVAVHHGDVTLSGPTDNQQTVDRIERVAARIAGRGHVFPMV